MWLSCLKSGKVLSFIGGAAAATLGVKALKSEKTRELCVKGLAKGMKLQKDAQEVYQNMKEDASDLCHEAREEADSKA